MLTLHDLDEQMEGDVSPAGLLYMTVGLVVGCGLMLGGLAGTMLGHFWLEPEFDIVNGTVIGGLVGAVVFAVVSFLGLRATADHMTGSID